MSPSTPLSAMITNSCQHLNKHIMIDRMISLSSCSLVFLSSHLVYCMSPNLSVVIFRVELLSLFFVTCVHVTCIFLYNR